LIKGIGVDIVEISRIKQAINKHQRFKKRFFTSSENEYCEGKADAMQHYAGRFAAKEAVVKALGTGFKGFKWQSIEIINTSSGKPEVRLKDKASLIADELKIKEIMISISHSENYAIAQAIAIGGGHN